MRSCGIKNTDSEDEHEEFERNGLDEEWEKSVYRLCVNNSFLMKRILNIVNILNFIKNLSNDEDKMSECISSLIGLTSITSVDRSSTSEVVSRRSANVISYDTLDEINKYLEENQFKKTTIDVIKYIYSDFNKTFDNKVHPLFSDI